MTNQLEPIYTKSVTRDDLGKVKNGVMQLIVPYYYGDDRRPLPPMLPPYWSFTRDAILRSTIHQESMWAAAIGIAITKVASLSWEITGETASAKRIKEVQQLILQAGGRQVGWTSFISKHLRDYLLTDNGAFIEIVRATKAIGSKIVGLRHLDSLRCLDRDTEVMLDRTESMPIWKMVEEKYDGTVLTMNENTGIMELNKVIGWHKNKIQPDNFWVEFETTGGKYIKCTGDHKIFSESGWVEASTLDVGKRVLVDGVNAFYLESITYYQKWDGGDIETFCIDVEKTHNFICGGGIVVHNCTRTGDPVIPLLYRDKLNRIHELRDHQVMMFSEMPDPSETFFDVGLCAASRAYNSIYKLMSIENYLKEKVTGIKPLAIYIVNGVLDKQLKDAVETAKNEQVGRGLASYMGAVILGVPEDSPPQLVTIPLAELPDRFARKEEFDISILTYADNLGLDPQDLQPLSGQSMGTGAQSQVLHDKAQGKGLVAWRQSFTHSLNDYVTPQRMIFAFTELDYRDLQQKVAISKARVEVSAARIQAGITQASQELQLLVDDDELPAEFLQAPDMTPGGTVGDDDKVNATEEVPAQIWGGEPVTEVASSDDGTNVPVEQEQTSEEEELEAPAKIWGENEKPESNKPEPPEEEEEIEEQEEESEEEPAQIWGLGKKKPKKKTEEETPAQIWGKKEYEKGIISKEAIEVAYALLKNVTKKENQ